MLVMLWVELYLSDSQERSCAKPVRSYVVRLSTMIGACGEFAKLSSRQRRFTEMHRFAHQSPISEMQRTKSEERRRTSDRTPVLQLQENTVNREERT